MPQLCCGKHRSKSPQAAALDRVSPGHSYNSTNRPFPYNNAGEWRIMTMGIITDGFRGQWDAGFPIHFLSRFFTLLSGTVCPASP